MNSRMSLWTISFVLACVLAVVVLAGIMFPVTQQAFARPDPLSDNLEPNQLQAARLAETATSPIERFGTGGGADQASTNAAHFLLSNLPGSTCGVSPVVTATRTISGDLLLSWTAPSNNVHHYELYRSTVPYFATGDPVNQLGPEISPPDHTFTDACAFKQPIENYAYVVRALCTDGSILPDSNRVGTFSFEVSGDEPVKWCQVDKGTHPFDEAASCFVGGLVHQSTGLVSSQEGECFTTLYKNSLAAITYIHQGQLDKAERIFDFFQGKLTDPFPGFPQVWDACEDTVPPQNQDCWEGDNAFLLLALNYYAQTIGGFGRYGDLAADLKDWLSDRAISCRVASCANPNEPIIAEGVADMYAALAPFGNNLENWQALTNLNECFFNSENYEGVADHIVRGALAFGDVSGFDNLSNFQQTEQWQCNGDTLQAYAANSSEPFINVEISAQLSTALQLWQSQSLRLELEKVRLQSSQTEQCGGLPYYIRRRKLACFDHDYSRPIVDSTTWLLYDYWGLNPFAPGRLYAGCRYDRFIPLVTNGQSEGFPRLFRVGQDPLDPNFPQEINDSGHKQIIIEFSAPTYVSQVPITLTVAAVPNGVHQNFAMSVKLDDNCKTDCFSSGSYANSAMQGTLRLGPCKSAISPMILQRAGSEQDKRQLRSNTTDMSTYRLVLEGTRQWMVFDWLQLETTNEVLWTIGYKDGRCTEFDNNGFVFRCY